MSEIIQLTESGRALRERIATAIGEADTNVTREEAVGILAALMVDIADHTSMPRSSAAWILEKIAGLPERSNLIRIGFCKALITANAPAIFSDYQGQRAPRPGWAKQIVALADEMMRELGL